MNDDQLDAYIAARLALLGVDLSVIPEDDPGAPVDRRRIMLSARNFLRNTVLPIAERPLPDDAWPPILNVAALAAGADQRG